MRKIRTQDALGCIIPHDLTQIIPGEFKGARFKKGHVVREEDIPVLLSMGKEHLYILEIGEDMAHEDEGAGVLASLCASGNMTASAPSEGKIDLFAESDGLLKVDTAKLAALNSAGNIAIASRYSGTVRKGDKIAGMRVIPLLIERAVLDKAVEIGAGKPVFGILPFTHKRCAIITTGNEVAAGRVKDSFTTAVMAKLAKFPSTVIGTSVVGDDPAKQTELIHHYAQKGAQIIILTGGMSVDPDDRTPLAIRNSGAEIVSYGAPVLPGSMMMVSYYNGGTPVLGLPGCVMYSKRTIFDILLPKFFADDPVTGGDIAGLGYGGLCLNCEVCAFPNCGFGSH
ncbi:MAG: molybdopterin-binding protein [Defluviitaleaceae bacterium]|nr:molybdopterin-binding protein [Defluviitaleaceae bacterium]